MADWNKITERGNVEDRRMNTPVALAGGGIGTILLLMGITYALGGNPLDVLNQIDPAQFQTQVQEQDTTQFQGQDAYETFVSTVLGSTNSYWKQVLSSQHVSYTSPKLVLFRRATESGCGGAQSYVGPHYCPNDETIYLDDTFFEELTQKFGAKGGDVAQSYVIAHEVGHHVQDILGNLDAGSQSNKNSIRTELQADCYAGLWLGSLKSQAVLEPNEISEALDAAAAVGDERIQKETLGRVQPESWTHGSSAQRVAAFNHGYESGVFEKCSGDNTL